MKFYGLWSPKGDDERIKNCLETGIWYRGDCPDEKGERKKFNELKIGDNVFLYVGIEDVALIESPFARFLPANRYDLNHTVVKAKCYSTGKITAINSDDLSISVDWDLSYPGVEWFLYFRQDGVWKVHNNKSIANVLEKIIYKKQQQNYEIEIGYFKKYEKRHENMEQEFTEWLAMQLTQTGISYTNQNGLIRDLRETIPNWNEVQQINLFEIHDIDAIEDLYQRCSTAGDLNERSMSVSKGKPMLALRKYKEFLEQRDDIQINNENQAEPVNEENMNKQPLNQILYGPPGTGKTYSTVSEALKILQPNLTDDEIINSEIISIQDLKTEFGSQVEFITFHQSFSYEDFVEGIKVEPTERGLNYEPQAGVFKQICENAKNIAVDSNISYDFDEQQINIWKISLGDTKNSNDDFVYPYCIENNKILLGFGKGEDFTGLNNRKNIADKLGDSEQYSYPPTAINTLKNKMKKNDVVMVSHGNTKVKAVGRISGDYQHLKDKDELNAYVQSREVEWLLVAKEPFSYEKILYKKLSQMSIYDIKKNTKINELKGLLNQDKTIEQKPHILIVDEINRGNISRIFGELITLIEPSKRAGANEEISVRLPYSKESFSVPKNLYIIGTMNTADRSLAQLDIALRRRFRFIEMMPEPKLLDEDITGINLQKLLKAINTRICQLLDREHQIGHSFFMKVKGLEDLKNVFEFEIIPLLEEYFFDDWDNIKKVLCDNNDVFYKKIQIENHLKVADGNEVLYEKRDFASIDKEDFIAIYKPNTEQALDESP